MEIVKQDVEHLNGAVVGGNELKWPGMDHVPSSNCKVLYSRNDKLRRNGVASLLRQDAVQVVRGYNARSDQEILTTFMSMLPTTEAEEDEVESSYACIREEIDHTYPNKTC